MQKIVSRMVFAALAGLAMIPCVVAQVSVLTHHNDLQRTGANLQETQLTTSTVNVNSFGKLFSYPVDGSIYAQPLYVSGVNIKSKGVHNVVFVATMNDTVYAFDADSNAGSNASPLWTVTFVNPAAGITAIPGTEIQTAPNVSGTVGILSTPVIDGTAGTIYLIARTKENGSYFQRLHALDITSGEERPGSPAVIQASVPGTGYDSKNGVVTFNPMTANQRCALALTNGKLVIAWGGLDDDFDPYHGWVMTFDPSTLQRLAVFNTTPNGSRAGLWESGSAAPVDANGNVYFTTGNGDWDGVTNFGDTMLKLNPSNGLVLSDWFTPDNQAFLNVNDLDLGVSGPILIPNTNLLLGGSKQGIVYLLNTSNMGHLVQGNGQIVQTFQAANGHIHGAPVYYNSPGFGPLIYLWSEGDALKAFHFNGTKLDQTPVMQSSFSAPPGMPGGMLSISANGSQPNTGIVWLAIPKNADAETHVVSGVMRAFDASDLSRELWNSTLNTARDDVGNFGKFSPPTIANGKVYLATFSNRLNVYGLLSTTPDFSLDINPTSQTAALGASRTYAVNVSVVNGLNGPISLSATGAPPGVTLAFNPETLSGTGTSTLTATVSPTATLGSYTLRITGTSGSLTHSVDVGLVISTVTDTLNGVLTTPTETQNLTQLGTSDWAHWGRTSTTTFDHKSTGGTQISNYTAIGSPVQRYVDNPVGFTWTDGTPGATATNNTTGVFIEGQNNGFRITAPADTTLRTLSVYVGVFMAQGKMVAHLSDSGTADYVDTTLNNATDVTTGLYTFTYQAASAGQTLTVTFTQTTNTGNVTLQAAALKITGPPAPDFSLSASPATQNVLPGANVSYTVTVAAQNGFAGVVGLTVSGLPTGASATFTPTSISGSGTSTLSVIAGSSTPLGSYPLTVTGASGTLNHTASLTLVVKSAVAGSLTSVLTTPTGVQNLTQLGTSDWTHWGRTSATTFDHKSTGGTQISNYTAIGSPVQRYVDNPNGFTWTDGTPGATATNNTTGVFIEGQNNGFRITAPADTTLRTFSIYVGVYMGQGKMIAHLSDSSATDYVDTTLNNATAITTGLYTFTYQAASAGQTLTVTFTQTTNTGNVALQAATLKIAGPPTPDFALTATPASQDVLTGANISYTVTVAPQNGFNGAVGLTVSGLPTGASATFTPTSISGSGISTLSVMAGSNTPLGSYPLTVTGSSGILTHTASLTLVVKSSVPGSLTSTLTSPSGVQDLTQLGTSDWAHWGRTSTTTFDHKSAGGTQISNFTAIGSHVQRYVDNPFGFTWIDGTPGATATNNTTGVFIEGPNNGFRITAPADTTARTFSIYVGVYMGQAKMVAHLSDGSAADYVDTTLNNPTAITTGLYTFTYQAASAGQTLTVTFTQTTNTGNVALQAATLKIAGPPTPDFLLTATPASQDVLPGANASYTVTVAPQNGFNGAVGLTVSGLPTGANATFTPDSISGSGTSTLSITAGSSTPLGSFPLTVTGASGALNHTASLTLVVKSAASGSLTTVLTTPTGVQNLTQLGTSDWAHWGRTNATTFDHKSTGGTQISNYTAVGTRPVQRYTNNPFGFTWTGGTPGASATNNATGVFIEGQDNGFRITAPADTTTRTLSVYVGVFMAQGKIVAHLSDGSAADYLDTTLINAADTTNGMYTFTYQAASPGQTLTVTFTQITNTGNVTFQAATLK